ncbi:MAG TPA: AraC family transcriptional regulator [Pirellulales bacterium]|nr:AraC family transcriptional regulator [Pirellulales bacterium]
MQCNNPDRKQTRIGLSTVETEHSLTGDALGLPLVRRVAVIRSQAASRVTWHSHPRIEALFLLEGATAYEFADGRTVELPGGHFLIVPRDVRHRGLHDVRKPVQLCGVMFDPRGKQAARQAPFTRAELGWLDRQFARGAIEPCRMGAELRRLVRTLNQQVIAGTSASETAAASLRLTLCATLLQAARQLTAPRALPPTRTVQTVIDFMESHLAEPLAMDDLAREANCSRARLFQIFKDATGMTPNHYLQRLRIQRAQTALASTDEPVTSIALRCGFSTSQYFSNVFRKHFGLTPSDFRRRER